ncbi:LysR family transcriptional regulator [Granulosicoccus sp. 3-233]|uniref:LysR family transcriptional regulator n=1 Tax=Granulosicoccus sp. 3-233 TaxID=3417969 RepID=UPI003D34CCCE
MRHLTQRLQWRHLRLLSAIDESGQLSMAAERLAITQPAASRMLAEIEGMVEQPLFVRKPKGMVPTPIGQVLIRHAVSLLRGLTATANEVNAFAAGKTGSVRVGSVTGAAVAYVVPSVQKLRADTQGADITIAVAPSEELIQGLHNGDYDFVLARVPPPHDRRQFEFMQGRAETVEFLARCDHPLLSLRKPTLKDFRGYAWVIQGVGTPMRDAVERAYIEHSIPLPDEIINTTSLLVMIASLQSSDALSPISSEVAELLAGTTTGDMTTLRFPAPITIQPYHLIQKKQQTLSPLAVRLRDLVIEALRVGP